MRLVPISVLGALLLFPATAFAQVTEDAGDDETMTIMFALIFFLMAAMIVIGILESRGGGEK